MATVTPTEFFTASDNFWIEVEQLPPSLRKGINNLTNYLECSCTPTSHEPGWAFQTSDKAKQRVNILLGPNRKVMVRAWAVRWHEQKRKARWPL